MRLFYWTKDEYGCPEWTRRHADKLWHFLGCGWVTTWVHYRFNLNVWIAGVCVWIAAFTIFEWLIACILTDEGASKLDALSNTMGIMLAIGAVYV